MFTSRHKQRFIFLGIRQVTKTKRYLYQFVLPNGKHSLYLDVTEIEIFLLR